MSSKVVHVLKLSEHVPVLQQLLPGTKIVYLDNQSESENNSDIEIIIGKPMDLAPLIYKWPNLKWCQSSFAGVNEIVDAFKKKGHLPQATVTRFGGYLSRHIAEWTIARIVGYERKFIESARHQQERFWGQQGLMVYRPLYQTSIGIVGFGDIGQTIAKRCKGFDMTVYGVGRTQREKLPDDVDGYRTFSEKDDLLSRCDYICSVLPATEETNNVFDNDALKAYKEKSPVFINVGRGNVIKESSIIHALDHGWIRHAILDVYEVEPLPAESKLWNDRRVTISPHVSGCTLVTEVCQMFADNYQRYINGEPLKFVVDLCKGY